MNRRGLLKPCRLEILAQAFAASLSAKAAFAVATKPAGGVEQIRAIDPHDAGFQLCGDVQRHIDAFAPHASGQAVNGIVGEFDRLTWRAEGHRRKNGTENLLLSDYRTWMNVAKQRRRKIQSTCWQPSIPVPLDAFELHARDDRSEVDGLIERRADTQRVHAVLNLADPLLRDAFLHQQARTGTTQLP